MPFLDVLTKYRKYSYSERDKGDRFERLMQAWLRTDPQYAFRLKNVWLWSEFPFRNDFGGKDTGIDLVALTTDGDYWAIQCKCYQADTVIDKQEVDSFLSTSSREFRDGQMRALSFAQRLWISSTNRWGTNAEEAIRNQNPPVTRVNLHSLEQAPVDWERLEQGIIGESARLAGREIKPHQQTALEKAHAYFTVSDRGKMIMACGTGKTFTALRIAEHETSGKGLILFLVPSIALLGQTLREWTTYAKEPINAVCICSDPKVSRKHTKNDDTDSTSVLDLALPATTDVTRITRQLGRLHTSEDSGITVVFCTYQSIDVISQAQQELQKSKAPGSSSGIFDLVICDEAHRTTGYSLPGEDASMFTKVHDNNVIRAEKRLYMTATPRLFSDDAKARAAQSDIELCSMDDVSKYGEEFYRIGFGEAVERDLLSDYKVLILTLSDHDIPPALQQAIANPDHEITTDDASRLIGCINALSKQVLGDAGLLRSTDPDPMRRAVAFCQTIEVSKKITGIFNSTSEDYVQALPEEKRVQMVSVSARHIDGTMSAPLRDELLGWLKAPTAEPGECRVLTNVKCLSEGVDVPALDAVLFLAARNSPVDVVQSVGRVMRTSPGKKYGYIIIPVVVPADMDPAAALADNERYRVVWTVLNALRAHDDRFNATINKIDLNRKRPDQILVGRPDAGYYGDGREGLQGDGQGNAQAASDMVRDQLMLKFQQLQNVFFARMVDRVGDRRYWEQWAANVAQIAQRQVERIVSLIRKDGHHQAAFNDFIAGLRKNINPAITSDEAVEMLSQHIITKPVFDALFEGYSFVGQNAVSVSMQRMLDLLEAQTAEEDLATLQKFYDSVRNRAADIDNAEGKQKIILELYDKFFKTGFPKMVEKLGIVYTPVEVVDFIIHSVNELLRQEFGRTLSDENVHILDPFTGTGTFVTRLLQSGLIDPGDLERKYASEIHANEIVLLAYYIAAVNIENAFHDASEKGTEYRPFDGICLTDTFQLGETDELYSDVFASNSERVLRQKNTPLMVIMGNPPYSVGQKSANDNAQNQDYERLDRRIAKTYAAATKATNKNSLYDSYIRAFRWATDRLFNPGTGGIVAFVTNGAWLDSNSNDGFRKHLEKEYSSIWVFNLRGNQRTSGELSRREGGKIFGSGSRTPIAITLLVRKAETLEGKATIHYRDIGDYLSREEKLSIIRNLGSVGNPAMEWRILKPNDHGDWITQRNDIFETFIPIDSEKKFDSKAKSFFVVNSRGAETTRDAWVYNSSRVELQSNIARMVSHYNKQVEAFQSAKSLNPFLIAQESINADSRKISWSSSLISFLQRGLFAEYEEASIRTASYRPFFRQYLYIGDKMIHRRGQMTEFFPDIDSENLVICLSVTSKDFSLLISNKIPDLHFIGDTQAFPLYYYEKREKQSPTLFDAAAESEYIRRDGITNFVLHRAHKMYGKRVTKEDIFYYVYGILHSPGYRQTFADDLKKMLPRIPLVEEPRDFWSFNKVGRQLADLHIDYEKAPHCGEVIVTGADKGFFTVEKMRFPKKGQKEAIIYNSYITISKIPEKAYNYIVNGKSAIEWIMERYQVTTHKDSGITNDPNDWSREVGNPRYILDLLLSIINVSMMTVEIVDALPKLKFE